MTHQSLTSSYFHFLSQTEDVVVEEEKVTSNMKCIYTTISWTMNNLDTKLPILTSTDCSKVRTFLLIWLHNIPASILGSIISMADIASNRPNLWRRWGQKWKTAVFSNSEILQTAHNLSINTVKTEFINVILWKNIWTLHQQNLATACFWKLKCDNVKVIMLWQYSISQLINNDLTAHYGKVVFNNATRMALDKSQHWQIKWKTEFNMERLRKKYTKV